MDTRTLRQLTLALLCSPLAWAHFSPEELSIYWELDEATSRIHTGRALLQSLPETGLSGSGASGSPGSRSNGSDTSGSGLVNLDSNPESLKQKFPWCEGTLGVWCGQYHNQALAPRPAPKRGDTPCPANCSGVGSCQHDLGLCFCPAGYGGPDCSQPRKRPCWRMGTDKRDEGWHLHEEWSHSRCAGICDDDIAMCYCPPETKFGHQPAPAGSPLGTPPAKRGRPMYWCQPSSDADGKPVKWGAVPYADLLGPNGWCNSDVPKFTCPCRIDGVIGQLCNIVVEQVCPNQCSGRGECNQGFCKCHDGWYGHDCSRLRAGLPYTPADYETSKPWLEQVVKISPSAQDPPVAMPERRRPYIYVYDVATELSSDIMQYRIERMHCTYRAWAHANASDFVGYNAYGVESVLHELFLSSEHRTFDPEEADFFYVPLPYACLFDVYGWNPIPRIPADVHGPRTYGAVNMQREAARWLNRTMPYFARRGGRDHIWLTAHDEGACAVWKEVWPGIMLTHWGRTDFPHKPNTQYHADNYVSSIVHAYHPGDWVDHTSKTHPCFDPKKDLVIPAFKRPTHYHASPYMGSPPANRTTLAYFKGDMRLAPGQDPDCKYSRCIRQTLYNLSRAGGWWERHRVYIGAQHDQGTGGDYSQQLARSVFCLVLPGDGWSPRLEDAVLHGCIPVIIMDDVQAVFESILDLPSFSLRVAQKDIPRLLDILLAVTPERVAAMQASLAKVWHRYRYLGLPMLDSEAAAVTATYKEENGGRLRDTPGARFADSAREDAFGTLMEWLYSRIEPVRAGGP